MSIELSVVVPVFNEEAIIPELFRRLKESVSKVTEDFELIFINDGSKDYTLEKLVDLTKLDDRVKFINFSRNFGHQLAVAAGLDHCEGKAIVIIDGDLQDPPELIPELYERYKEGFKVVYAKRKSREGETFFKKITAKMFYRTLAKLTSIEIPLDTGDYRLIDREVVEYLKQMPEKNKFYRGQIAWIGFKPSFVEFNRDERTVGETGYTFKKMFSFAMDGITAFSDSPLKFASTLGFLVSGFSFLVILYALYSNFILNETISGWTSLIISFMFIGGVQLLALGIMGEYISRIITNVRNRPLYVIDGTNVKRGKS